MLLALFPVVARAEITGAARVIDGDTIDIAGERIRLHGIDAPESGQTCVVGLGAYLRTVAMGEFVVLPNARDVIRVSPDTDRGSPPTPTILVF